MAPPGAAFSPGPGLLMRSATASCAMMVAPGATPTGGNVTPTIFASDGSSASFSLPPTWSGSALVLMIKRTGLGGAGELMMALMDGLVQPAGAVEQCNPTQWLGAGAVNCVAISSTF